MSATEGVKDLRTPLARVRGLGSAREGTHHFVVQRITAIALLPLTIWFLVAALSFLRGEYADARTWLAQPWNASLMAAFVLALFHHAQLGLQVVIEDYVHTRWIELTLLIAVKFIAVLATIVCLLALIRIALGG
jgi:succinate dehydrogenase / fumarate reductase, membrane anchor subunit